MQEVHPVKFEVNLLPNAVKKIESIASMTGTSKSEVVEKMLLEYVPFEEDRALQLVLADIVTRTSALSEEEKRSVFLKVIKFVADICK
ncbi:MAG: hypothetical protein IJO83_08625 [Clostridia bacterium]|nr:hypothetical protein [Clostridia bacterium]